METIIPAAPDWRLCLPDPVFRKHLQIDILAWAISPTGDAVPITAFGRADVSDGYVVCGPNGFVALPNGPVLRDYNEASDFLNGVAS